jgi:hypothetical protein
MDATTNAIIIPPPELICTRAWECSWVLANDFPDRLADDRGGGEARHILRTEPGRLTWSQCGAMFRLFTRHVELRI